MPENDTQTHTEEIANIADELLSEMPAPQPSAMQSPTEENNESKSVGNRDSQGTAWNPEIHAQGADGKGVLTAKGEWRRRRGASKRSSVVGGASTLPAVPPADVQLARAAGVACAHSILMMGSLLGGAEWQPRILESSDGKVQLNEAEMMEKAFGDYFVAKGKTEFPPGVALAMALSAYVMPRFTMPQTRTRLQKVKEWAAAKYAKWKVRKQPKDKKEEPERKESSGKQQPVR